MSVWNAFFFYVELYIAFNAAVVDAVAASRQITKHIFYNGKVCFFVEFRRDKFETLRQNSL